MGDDGKRKVRRHEPDGRTAVIRARVTPAAKLQYEALAVNRGVSLSDLIESLLRDAAIADRVI